MRFISEPIVPQAESFSADTMSHGEPSLPAAFTWGGEVLAVKGLRKTWRGTKTDRGDVYLKRHWFEFETGDGRTAVVYFDRQAKRGLARWWLYTISG